MISLSLSLIPLLALAPSAFATPPQFSSCILGGDPCPANSICTQTSTCGGLCVTSYPVPPVTPCTVGGPTTPCGKSEICTQTEFCPSPSATPCGGQCLYTGPETNPPSLPTKPCVIGADDCADQGPGAYCTLTQTCNGVCLSVPPPVTVTSTRAPSAKPTTTKPPHPPQPCKCGKDCKRGYKCVGKHGQECKKPGQKCDGHCVKA